MSKTIIIQKNGVAQTMTVDMLRVNIQGGGSEDWVPEDGKNLVELKIGGSGTYKASDYNAYGISVARVTPKVGGGATAKAVEHDFTEKHTPSIKEGGKSRNFSAAMQKTNLQGGGTCLWIPKLDVVLKNKYISKSGTYAAKADDCYGFDQVTVSGVDVEITQDEDGDDVADVTNDGVTTREKLPSEIRIVHEPNFTGPYGDGAYIGFDGLVVHGYSASGVDLGEIPFNELVFPVTVADYDAQINTIYNVDAAGTHLLYLKTTGWPYPRTYTKTNDGQAYFAFVYITESDFNTPILISTVRDAAFETVKEIGPEYIPEEVIEPYYTVSREGVTFYANTFYALQGTIEDADKPIYSYFPSRELAISYLLDKIVAGETSGGGQRVPVQWNRPYDGQLLETSFYVEVVDVWTAVNGEN